ncbi:hypothetical protein HHI36_011986 [Cryptolaemus montrouzieri]|uniref:Uncharacterized protein n=1 Tax=Cryptolaemus montrouzieri TaxID=559131 RepID=A0ABD2NDG6_9CUCU
MLTTQKMTNNNTKKAYLETFGDNDDEKGYHTSTQDKGNDGYKKHEEFHKKDSDSYGFEKHSEFGNGKKGGKASKHQSSKGSQSAPSHSSYKVVENTDDRKKKAFEDYDGGHYAEGYHDGESEGYTSDAEYDGDSGHLESEGDGESEHYSAEESDGESEAYTAEGDEDDY